MGKYVNPGNGSFLEAVSSEIYIDKTGLIEYTNRVINSKQKHICVSRPRRFGKSMAVEMLAAYYDKDCDSAQIFEGLKISENSSYKKHINKYDVIYLDMQWFRSNADSAGEAISLLQTEVIGELIREYPEVSNRDEKSLPMVLADISELKKTKFVILIDEWDCFFREDKMDEEAQREYVMLLRGLFKGIIAEKFVALAYLTGILPIKKYGTESALNNFDEFTMIRPGMLSEYVGFTEHEVKMLCERYDMSFEEARNWYDGYHFYNDIHIYSPKSIVNAMLHGRFENFWTSTETYTSLKTYIEMNFDGLKDAIVLMLGGGSCEVNPRTFQNDLSTFKNKDDVLTLLIHLGYLAYDYENEKVSIPNKEIESVFRDAIKGAGWNSVIDAIKCSKELLSNTLMQKADVVAKEIEKIHLENTSIISYNDENALSCVITLAYYSAKAEYTLFRELPAGKGFADIVFVPKKATDKPAMLVELKWNKTVNTAID